eukprot:TRINITY_DN4795_c2_g1_i3.p1 TRINITY_DN4795_c2_g1~~TRINITY_DN4795_c2_g1_i3.p1  ORF type:complete len:100 (+),score=5.97 TRINITY_DN4795_c2_g1_i3:48-347(+)
MGGATLITVGSIDPTVINVAPPMPQVHPELNFMFASQTYSKNFNKISDCLASSSHLVVRSHISFFICYVFTEGGYFCHFIKIAEIVATHLDIPLKFQTA